MRSYFRGLRAAFTFLTRIPVGGFPYQDSDWLWATAHFPTVGAILGLLYAGLYALVLPFDPLVAGALVVMASLLVTGAFHEDGLADTFDAVGGGYTPQRVLEILKDSRVGAFGAAALGMQLLLRTVLLAALGPAAPVALVVSECLSRLGPIWLMVCIPYATSDSASKSRLLTRARPRHALAATAAVAAAALLLVGACGVNPVWLTITGAATVAGTLAVGAAFSRRVGGVTGDFLGASQQVGVVVALLVALLMQRTLTGSP